MKDTQKALVAFFTSKEVEGEEAKKELEKISLEFQNLNDCTRKLHDYPKNNWGDSW